MNGPEWSPRSESNRNLLCTGQELFQLSCEGICSGGGNRTPVGRLTADCFTIRLRRNEGGHTCVPALFLSEINFQTAAASFEGLGPWLGPWYREQESNLHSRGQSSPSYRWTI